MLALCQPSMGLCWPLLEAMLVCFGGFDGPSWGLTAPCLVLVGFRKAQTALKGWRAQNHGKNHEKLKVLATMLALCQPSMGLCWPLLEAMLAPLGDYVGPFWRL